MLGICLRTQCHDSPQVTVPLYWVIVVDVLNGIGVTMAIIYGIEFAIAQTPNRMRGIMMGLMLIMFWLEHTW